MNQNVRGRAENKAFITNDIYRSISAISSTVRALKAYLNDPSKETAAAAGKELTNCSQQAKKTKVAEGYYEKAIELQAMHQVTISNCRNLISVINRQIEIISEMAQKGLIPLGEKQRVEGSLKERKKLLEERISQLENRMKHYRLDDAIQLQNNKFQVHPVYASLLQMSKAMAPFPRKAGERPADRQPEGDLPASW